ncbi:MAG: hypothetical protein K0Q52_142 [Microbacterium sp.]|jgi:hypothetical protein|nr:hypothetical protein [Microbacterium sp.]
MTATVIPLPLWPHPEHLTQDQKAMIRQAKGELNLPYLIEMVPAVPGSPGRIMCFGEPAPFYSEHVVIKPENAERYESIKSALSFTLTAPPRTPGSFTEEMWLQALMGAGTKLIYVEEPDRLAQLVSDD